MKKKNWSMSNIKNIVKSFIEIDFSNLKLEHEFDRRVEEFNFQTNGNENDEERMNIIPVSFIIRGGKKMFNNVFTDLYGRTNSVTKCSG